MAGSKFQYDESGGTFFYFLVSFLALLVVPGTYYFWPTEQPSGKRATCHLFFVPSHLIDLCIPIFVFFMITFNNQSPVTFIY